MIFQMYTHQSNDDGVPAWTVIDSLGYKGRLYFANETGTEGVVLLTNPERPSILGVAWWDCTWDRDIVHDNIKWSRSPMVLLTWASKHKIAQQFGALLYVLSLQVRKTAN